MRHPNSELWMEYELDPSTASSSSLPGCYLSMPIRDFAPGFVAMSDCHAGCMTQQDVSAGSADNNRDETRQSASGFGSFLEMFQDASTDKSDTERGIR